MIPGETVVSGAPIDGVSEFKVMRSGAGWYVGTTCIDEEWGYEAPYSRETGYFATEKEAQEALDIFHASGYLPNQR